MHPDELNKPLGVDADTQAHPRRDIPWSLIAVGGLAVLGAGVFTFARMTESPAPDSAAMLASRAPDGTRAAMDRLQNVSTDDVTASIGAKQPRTNASDVEDASGVRVFRQGGAQAPGAIIISVPQAARVGLMPAPDRRLVEEGRSGPLPKIGPDGAKPMEVYARPLVESAKLPLDAPRIAFLIGGMGLNAQATEAAIASLPENVTLGFAPYGRNLAALSARAREKGHETILQAPMQGFGSEADEPGPHVLRTGAPAGETISRLHWHMSRFQGYVGVAGFMGARFTADAAAFAPVVREVANRGLLYFDDGGSPRSLSASLAAAGGAPFVRADVNLDGMSPGALDGALAQLEKIAHERGSAVGYGTGLPVVIDKVGRFAKRLESRGVMLAPVSALARVPDQATARTER
jgi:uncharacterized protein